MAAGEVEAVGVAEGVSLVHDVGKNARRTALRAVIARPGTGKPSVSPAAKNEVTV